MAIFRCKSCGAPLDIVEGLTAIKCPYCELQQTLPRFDDDRKTNLYDRANHFRRNNEYDKARAIYEQILNEDKTDAESYWSIILCQYGIEYVEDPTTRRRVPTVNRTQFTSVFADENYKKAIEYADIYQKSIYEQEAYAIDEIQKGILEISQKEEPFDVFICYKETDNNGRRTLDSVIANDLYHQLVQEGFKVFFSKITLEDKLGSAYEPYIFAALNSAKVMVVVGTKPEHFNAVWVKNEWSRYLALIKSGANKVLVPAYRDMDPYDLPEEFSHLQAQDMSKLGFMQDLIRGIKKISGIEHKSEVTNVEVVNTNQQGNAAALLRRAFMFLEDANWREADEYCEKVLDMEPENGQAYLYKLMAQMKASNKDALKLCGVNFENNPTYKKVLRFSDEETKKEIQEICEYNNKLIKYNVAMDMRQMAYEHKNIKECLEAATTFENITGFKDSDEKAKGCREKAKIFELDEVYDNAKHEKSKNELSATRKAIEKFESIIEWKDSAQQIESCKAQLIRLEDEKREAERKAEENRIAAKKIAEEEKRLAELKKEKRKKTMKIAIIVVVIIAILGAVAAIVMNRVEAKQEQAEQKRIAAEQKKEIERLAAIREKLPSNTLDGGGFATVGLKTNGTVVGSGSDGYDEFDLPEGTDYIAVDTSGHHTVGLKSDGTVVAVGNNDSGQCNVSQWKDIVSIAAAGSHTVGLKSDGTVVAVGYNQFGNCDVSDWEDIVQIDAGTYCTIGLKSDGTVIATGGYYGEDAVEKWSDIVAISAGYGHTVGLKSDGTVVAAGNDEYNLCSITDIWTDVVAISAGGFHTVVLKSDGTVDAFGNNDDGQCDVDSWNDIVAIEAGNIHTVGLKSDGTVVAVGHNKHGQCNVSGWNEIRTIR